MATLPVQVSSPYAMPMSRQDKHILQQALQLLGQIRNLPADEAYIRHMGINPPFQNGMQALQVIQNKGIRVEFGDMGDSKAHASFQPASNTITINRKYRGDASPATLYAISEALYHEAGHASGNGDGESSIQEELNCLALNVLANRYHQAIDPAYAQTTSTSRLIADGVALYSRLFFDPDPTKQGLVNRVIKIYGGLPLWSPGHPVPPPTGLDGRSPLPMAYRVAAEIDARTVRQGQMPASANLGQVPPGLPPAPPSVPMPSLPSLHGFLPAGGNPFNLATPAHNGLSASLPAAGQHIRVAA